MNEKENEKNVLPNSKNMEAYSLLFLQLQVDNHYQPFNARILVFGFISAESAVMGLLKG